MNPYTPVSVRSGHIGCSRGPPSARTVPRNARPTPKWYSRPAPWRASSGCWLLKSPHEITFSEAGKFETVCQHQAPLPDPPPPRDRTKSPAATGLLLQGGDDGEMIRGPDAFDGPGA